jgi:hypothetical protein
MTESKRRLVKKGTDPNCLHEYEEDTGRGSAAFFTRCTSCGAKFSYSVGPDPFYAMAESQHEPPWGEQ